MSEQPQTVRTASLTAATGVVVGAAVGDALGWPQEFRGQIVGGQRARDGHPPRAEFIAWARHSGHYTSKRLDPVGAGEYSDDTQLLCATARASLRGADWVRWLTDVELPAWPTYQRGGGGAVLTACNAWAAGRAPWNGDDAKARKDRQRYIQAGANGVAMRIAPHVLVEPSLPDALARVIADGVLTHGHPRALVGALVYAAALHAAVRQDGTLDYGSLVDAAAEGLWSFEIVEKHLPKDWPDDVHESCSRTWGGVVTEVEALLTAVRTSLQQGAMSKPEQLLTELGCTEPKINGAGTVTAAGALYLASRFAARPIGGVLQAAFLRRGDTDTLASMTAALLGGVHGATWLEGLEGTVQDNSYLGWLAAALLGTQPIKLPSPPTQSPAKLRKELHRVLIGQTTSTGNIRGRGEFPDGRTWSLAQLQPLPNSDLARATLELDDGQTVFVDVQVHGRARRGNAVSAPADVQPVLEVPDRTGDDSTAHEERAGITLGTRNVRASAAFYAALLGQQVPIVRGVAHVTDWLTLQTDDDVPATTRLILRFRVPDLRSTAQALGIAESGEVLRATDPDGRRVEVRANITNGNRA